MSDVIGRITVPAVVSSGLTFPLVTEFGYGYSQDHPIIVHRFGDLDAKSEQRYQVGIGPKKHTFRRSNLSINNRTALSNFWESLQGSFKSFTYAVPSAAQAFTNTTVVWEQSPLSFEYLVHAVKSGINFIEIPDPSSAPVYTVASTCTRFPSGTLNTALENQVQKIIPLVHIKVRESGVPDIYLSDRRCTVGGQEYLPRVLSLGEPGSDVIISQDIRGTADNVQFTFGDADGVMTALCNDTDLKYAQISLSLYHVNSEVLLNLWSGYIQTFVTDGSPQFTVQASDGIFQINQQYPVRTVSRTCWKTYNDGLNCPWASQGASSAAVIAAGGDPASCDYYWNSVNGCLVHGMADFFGGIPILPQSVSIKDNSTGFIGFDRNTVTATSIVSDTIWGKALAEIWCNQGSSAVNAFMANAIIAAVRDNGDFFDVLGIIGCGPLGAFSIQGNAAGVFVTNADGFTYLVAPLADGYPAQGLKIASNGTSTSSNSALGLRQVPGYDRISSSGDQSYNQFGLANIVGHNNPTSVSGSAASLPYSPETAFAEVLYAKVSGITPSSADNHSMTVPIAQGLTGWIWDGSDTRTAYGGLINPFWIAVNTFLRALGMNSASSADQLAMFVRSSLYVGDGSGAAEIADTLVTKILGAGTELQFQFQGSLDSQKPLRDWLVEILNCGLGYYTWEFGKLKLGCRINASAVDSYTQGNMKFLSLRLTPFDATFEKLTIDFADIDYQFQANIADYEDKDHSAYYGRAGSPLSSRMHSVGSPTLSQNLRIAATRTREEIGGVNAAEWRTARNVSWETTLLGLSNEVGQVVSITDTKKVPGLRGVCNVDGSGNVTYVSGDAFDASMQSKEILINGVQSAVTTLTGSPVTSFTTTPTAATGSNVTFKIITMDVRIQSWQLRKDWSIGITAKTVVPSMYDLDVGPKPFDVLPQPSPVLTHALPFGSAWCPYQIQFPSNDAMFPNEWTFDIDQAYEISGDGSVLAEVTLTGKLPTNVYSPTTPSPTVTAMSQATTGGSIAGDELVKITVCAIDANGLPSPPDSINVVYVPAGTSTNKITLASVTWPAVTGLTKYVVFASTADTLLCEQVSGTLTPTGGGTTYTPTSIDVTALTRASWAMPNSNTKRVKAKAKNAVHSGVIGTAVDTVSAGKIICGEIIDTTGGGFTPVGRVVSLIGRPEDSTPVYNATITGYNAATGELDCTPDPSGTVLAGDTIVIRFLGYDNSANPTQFTDTGIKNQPSDAYSGFTPDVEIGTIFRVIKGTGRGQIRKITGNTDDTLSWDTPLVLDSTSVITTEELNWTDLGDATDVLNADPLAVTQLGVPTSNFINRVLIFSVFTVDINGNESVDGDQPIREEWIFGQEGIAKVAGLNFQATGTLGVEAIAAGPIYLNHDVTAGAVKAYVQSPPTGADLKFTLYLDGTSWIDLIIPDGLSSVVASPSAISALTALTANKSIILGVTQVGSSYPGLNLTVFVYS